LLNDISYKYIQLGSAKLFKVSPSHDICGGIERENPEESAQYTEINMPNMNDDKRKATNLCNSLQNRTKATLK
jgi:hypothetical protein